jgi:hypothetical protein
VPEGADVHVPSVPPPPRTKLGTVPRSATHAACHPSPSDATTSRSCAGVCTTRPSSTSTAPPRRRSPNASWTPSIASTGSTTPTCTAAPTPSRPRRPTLYEAARTRVARFINAPDERSVVFVRNATEGINLVAHAWGRRAVATGRRDRRHRRRASRQPRPLAPARGRTRRRDPRRAARQRPARRPRRATRRDVAAHQARRHLPRQQRPGRAQPDGGDRRGIAHEAGALLLVDGAQAVPHLPVDVQALGADMYAFSGPQGRRTVGHRRALGPRVAARDVAAVHGRGGDDPHRRGDLEHLRRHPHALRGRHAGDRRGRRSPRRARLPRRASASRPSGTTTAHWRATPRAPPRVDGVSSTAPRATTAAAS